MVNFRFLLCKTKENDKKIRLTKKTGLLVRCGWVFCRTYLCFTRHVRSVRRYCHWERLGSVESECAGSREPDCAGLMEREFAGAMEPGCCKFSGIRMCCLNGTRMLLAPCMQLVTHWVQNAAASSTSRMMLGQHAQWISNTVIVIDQECCRLNGYAILLSQLIQNFAGSMDLEYFWLKNISIRPVISSMNEMLGAQLMYNTSICMDLDSIVENANYLL